MWVKGAPVEVLKHAAETGLKKLNLGNWPRTLRKNKNRCFPHTK